MSEISQTAETNNIFCTFLLALQFTEPKNIKLFHISTFSDFHFYNKSLRYDYLDRVMEHVEFRDIFL